MNTKTTKNWFWAPPKDWCRLNKIAKLYMSRRSLVRSDHVAPHSKSIQSFRGGCMHVCECCALALIIFALSFCSLCVSTSERFISWLHSNLRCESAPLHRFIHLPLLHLFACCCCYKWLTRSYLSLCLSRCCTVIFCCAPLLFFLCALSHISTCYFRSIKLSNLFVATTYVQQLERTYTTTI